MKYLRPSIVLFAVAFLAYGLLIPQLGFYWDDLPISWISYQLGPEALTRYFASSRPLWGDLYKITRHIFPQVPFYWQAFALLWRWLGAVVVYMIVQKLWRDKTRMALGIALIFLVYPGFNQHFAAFLYSHFYIVLFCLLLSFLCMSQAIDSPKRYWAWTVAGMVSSALNLFVMEYFFVPELARVGIILIAIRDEKLSLRERILRALKLWTPYLAVFMLGVLSRMFISNNQDYGMVVVDQLKSAPLEAIKTLIQTIWVSLQLVLKDAWSQMFVLPDVGVANPSVLISYYIVVAVAVLITAAGFVFALHEDSKPIRKNFMDALLLTGLGLLWVLLSGWPFWLIGFTPSLAWPASRFTLPFLFGVSLFFGGLIALIPWERARIVLLVSLVSLAVGKQYLTAQDYRHDWAMQKGLFWQMTWRAPGMEPGTTVLINEGALDYYADNSLSAALNWVYAPDNHSDQMDYVLFYPRTRLKTVALPKLDPGFPVYFNYEAGEFHGNTSQILSMYYAPPGCLRILDPEVEAVNRLIPETSLMRFAAHLTEPGLILAEPRTKMPEVYDPEPEHGFCYFFQKADFARQFKDWDTVLKMSEVALSFEDHPYDPAEQMVFIEGYAHAEEWGRAIELSKQAHAFSEETVGRMLCQLWKRIEAETGEGPERSEALSIAQSMFVCNP
jgi:hypothetical protein